MVGSRQKGFITNVVLLIIGLLGLTLTGYFAYRNWHRVQTKPILTEPNLIMGDNGFQKPKPPYYLVLSGDISKDYQNIMLAPFFFVTSSVANSRSEKTTEAQFKIVLKLKGGVIFEKEVDAYHCIDFSPGDYCGKNDHSYGHFLVAIEGILEMPDELIIFHQGNKIYNLKPKTSIGPRLTIKSQEYRDGFINVYWENLDENSKYHYQAYVTNNNFKSKGSGDSKTVTLIEGFSVNNGNVPIFNEDSFLYSHLGYIEGDLQVALYITDGFNSYVWYSNTFESQKNKVEARIEYPENGKTYDQNSVSLQSFSRDARSGMSCGGCKEEGNSFEWTSDVNGVISTSPSGLCQYLTAGKHKITLKVKNVNGTEDSTSVQINITPATYELESEFKLKQQKREFCYY